MRVASRSALLALLVGAACTGTNDTDGRGGTIMTGQTVMGSLTSSDNAVPPDRVMPYSADVWTLSLTAGRPIAVLMCKTNNNLDPLLSLFLGSMRVAVDDDMGGNNGALIRFTPMTSGTYQLYAQDCCIEPVPNDGMNRDYTIRFINDDNDAGDSLTCPPVGDAAPIDAPYSDGAGIDAAGDP